MKIERPDWNEITDGGIDTDMFKALNAWFYDKVDPVNKILRDGDKMVCLDGDYQWYFEADAAGMGSLDRVSHTAFLTNIQSIKKETCADVLRDWVELVLALELCDFPKYKKIKERAKIALENES